MCVVTTDVEGDGDNTSNETVAVKFPGKRKGSGESSTKLKPKSGVKASIVKVATLPHLPPHVSFRTCESCILKTQNRDGMLMATVITVLFWRDCEIRFVRVELRKMGRK